MANDPTEHIGGRRMQTVKAKPIPKRTYTPVGTQVALHVHLASELESGLVLPDNAQGSYNTPVCTVIAVGPKVEQVKEGQRVLVGPMVMFLKVRHDGQETAVLDIKHIVGVVDETNENGEK